MYFSVYSNCTTKWILISVLVFFLLSMIQWLMKCARIIIQYLSTETGLMFCLLSERPDGESHRNLSRDQLHYRRTDLTRWKMLQCLQRYLFLLTLLSAVVVVWIVLLHWTYMHQTPTTARNEHYRSLPDADSGCASAITTFPSLYTPYECFLAGVPIRADWSVCYKAPAMPICLNPAALAGRYYRVNSHW